jgi:DNA repair exonuclease SbcCD ATPase subunit
MNFPMINDDVKHQVLSLQLHWYDQALDNAYENISRLIRRIDNLESQIRRREEIIERYERDVATKDAHLAQLNSDNQHLVRWILELLRD